MATSPTASTHLSNLQLELLKLYPYTVSNEELNEICLLLADFFARKVDEEMNQLAKEKNWNEQTFETWKTDHLRSRNAE